MSNKGILGLLYFVLMLVSVVKRKGERGDVCASVRRKWVEAATGSRRLRWWQGVDVVIVLLDLKGREEENGD